MDAHDEYEKGHLSNKEWFIAFKNALPQSCCLKESDFWHAWQLLLGEEKGAVQLLKTLCETYSIWLLSNTNPKHIQEEIKKRYSFPYFIDGAVYSFNVGYRKPEENNSEKYFFNGFSHLFIFKCYWSMDDEPAFPSRIEVEHHCN